MSPIITPSGGAGLNQLGVSVAPLPSGGDDTTALQAAITATPLGGTLLVPSGVYTLSAALTIPRAISMYGQGVTELYGSQATDANTVNFPILSPYLAGTVFTQTTAATDGIQVTAIGQTVNLDGFGIIFPPAIRWTNTGNGITAQPAIYTGAERDNGIMASRWRGISVWGHDGNHYAFDVTNPIACTLSDLHGYGGGLLRLTNNGASNYGNTLIDHPFGAVVVAGTAHGIRLVITNGNLNLLQFNRPQVNLISISASVPGDPTPPTNAQQMFKSDASVSALSLFQPDFETNVSSSCTYPTTPTNLLGVWIDPAGDIPGTGTPYMYRMQGEPANVYIDRQFNANLQTSASGAPLMGVADRTGSVFQTGYIQNGKQTQQVARLLVVGAAATAAAGSAAGVTPPAPVITGKDSSGTITFGTGTLAAAGDQVAVTFSQTWAATPNGLVVTPLNALTAALQLYVDGISSSGFSVAATVAPASSQANTTFAFSYVVIG